MAQYRHVVLFKLYDGVSDEARAEAVRLLTELGVDNDGIESWLVRESIDTRKGHILIEEAVFSSESDYQAFRISDRHVHVGNVMKELADWWVADYLL